MGLILSILAILGLLWAIVRIPGSLLMWTVVTAAGLLILSMTGIMPGLPGLVLWLGLLLVVIPLNIPDVRQRFLSAPMLSYIRRSLPPISDTERDAIEAGTVWWEADLFRGDPDWDKFDAIPDASLTAEEQAFIDGPVNELCALLNDWEITHELNDLPKPVWEFLAEHRFFGLNIPSKYGGHGFSPVANSAVVLKVSSRSGTAGVTVMVPNSLGPAELILHYGTDKQKEYYLPRLASGEEIPCFALTNPTAGSDAGAIPDAGIVCKGDFQGEEVLGLRVSWNKRYITLAPVASLLGLAFKAYDPDHLLGDQEELGISCALIPTATPGVEIGRRHAALNTSFQNGPTRGKDVFIPMDWVIGGQQQLGNGWRMLMESLAAGRGISLPASGVAAAKLAARTTGAYARIREQFGLPIGKFEGVEEVLARIGGLTYMMDSTRLLTVAGLQQGEKPSIVSAIVKYHLTEHARTIVNDAMDIHGGRGICMGPMNYLARGYQQIPIGITVEGANILTRSLIIFGQGAMRCHPYLLDEIGFAAQTDDDILDQFDDTLMDHIGYTFKNFSRSLVYGLSGGWLAPVSVRGEVRPYYQAITRYSAAFSFMADVGLLSLGGALKRKEKLSGRYADALSNLYMATAVLKHYANAADSSTEWPVAKWALDYCLYEVQQAMDGVLRNFPVNWLGWIIRAVVFPLGRRRTPPSDNLGHKVARVLMSPSVTRDGISEGIYISNDPEDITGRIDDALIRVMAAAPVRSRLRKDAVAKRSDQQSFEQWLKQLKDDRHIDDAEALSLQLAETTVDAVIQVDDFAP